MANHPLEVDTQLRNRLLDWWNTMDASKPIVRKLMSLITELRLNPKSSRANGMILLYRAVSEVSYGYAGVRGCIRRAFTQEYGEGLRFNMVRCHSFAERFSVDTKVLLELVARQITDKDTLRLINSIRETLKENDIMLREIKNKADAFFGKETLSSMQETVKQSITLPET